MLRALILMGVGVALAALPAVGLAEHPTLKILPPQGNTDVYPIVTVPAKVPPGARRERRQTCAGYLFTVTAAGTPEDVTVWSRFPADSEEFARAGQAAIEKWQFHPHTVDGQAVAAHDVFFVMSYLVRDIDSKQDENRVLGSHIASHRTQTVSAAQESLRWLCSQPPLHGVSVVAESAASASEPAPANPGGFVPDPVVPLPADGLPAAARPGNVHIRFCIDTQGRVADTVVVGSSPHGLYDEAALRALEATPFTVRKIDGGATVACGLMVRAHFTGARSGEIGRIDHVSFHELAGAMPATKLVAQKPARISLHIPAGTPLPKVAKVEVRMCIEKDGTPSGASVVRADPPQYFDAAALETVAGWRFAHRDRRMCDVYQWVRFPLGG